MLDIDSRKEKGQQIASAKKIRKLQGDWVVPSQTGSGVYVVSKSGCTCPDWETHRDRCKHMFAVEIYVQARKNRDGSVTVTSETVITKKATYKQDWESYNAAQTCEKEYFGILLQQLCAGLKDDEGPRGRGRPKLPISDAVFSSVMKVYTTVSGRRATGDLKACKEKGLVKHQPHYNSVFRYLENPALKPILENLILQSALPLKAFETSFSIDASGFSTCTYERWFDAKYGKEMSQQNWLKAHITIGNKTNVVTGVEITDSHSHDNNHFVSLLEHTAKNFNVSEIAADKGYLDKKNFVAAEELGIEPYIMFKKNTLGKGPAILQRLFHMYMMENEKFNAHYHQRSNVETTFSMIKKKFGPALRSKSEVSQVNELLCKILAHNICCLVSSIFELNVEIDFLTQRQAA